MTDGVMAERRIFASSHSSGDLGSLSDCLKGRAVAATDGVAVLLVVATADAQCVVTDFKLDAAEFELEVEKMVFITIVGRAV